MSGSRRRQMMAARSALSAYLEGDGRQWIDSGIVRNLTTKMRYVAGFAFPDMDVRRVLIIGAQGFFSFGKANYEYLQVGQPNDETTKFRLEAGRRYDIDVTFDPVKWRRIYTFEGETITEIPPRTGTGAYNNNLKDLTVWLFRANNDGIVGRARIYYCKIYRNDVLMRDYVPVRVGSTGYMYDKVSGRLFGNSGEGSLVIGPGVRSYGTI